MVTRGRIEAAYGRLKSLSAPVIARELDLPEEVAEQTVPMLAIYRALLDLFHAGKLIAPPASLMDVLAGQMLLPAEKAAFETAERAGAVALRPAACRTGGGRSAARRTGAGERRPLFW